MTNPSVVFHVPNDYPPILMEMFSADILAQLPDGTVAEIRHFIDQVDEIKAGLKAVQQMPQRNMWVRGFLQKAKEQKALEDQEQSSVESETGETNDDQGGN